MEHTPLTDLPQSLVEEEARHIIQDVVQENMRRGVSKDDIEAHREDIFNRAAQSSSERVKVNYILSRIADEEKITVTEADMEKRFSEMVNQYGQNPEKLKADMEKRGAIETLRRNLRLEKAVDLLHAAATINQE
jgi:trigger factor